MSGQAGRLSMPRDWFGFFVVFLPQCVNGKNSINLMRDEGLGYDWGLRILEPVALEKLRLPCSNSNGEC